MGVSARAGLPCYPKLIQLDGIAEFDQMQHENGEPKAWPLLRMKRSRVLLLAGLPGGLRCRGWIGHRRCHRRLLRKLRRKDNGAPHAATAAVAARVPWQALRFEFVSGNSQRSVTRQDRRRSERLTSQAWGQ